MVVVCEGRSPAEHSESADSVSPTSKKITENHGD